MLGEPDVPEATLLELESAGRTRADRNRLAGAHSIARPIGLTFER